MSVLSTLKSFSSDNLTFPGIRIGSKTIKLNFGPRLMANDDQNVINAEALRRSRTGRRGAEAIEQALNASPRPPVDLLFSARL